MKIVINLKNVYGEVKAYPVCDKARNFAAIAGTKTLTAETLKLIGALGYTVECVDALTLADLK